MRQPRPGQKLLLTSSPPRRSAAKAEVLKNCDTLSFLLENARVGPQFLSPLPLWHSSTVQEVGGGLQRGPVCTLALFCGSAVAPSLSSGVGVSAPVMGFN
jgi:hypothetical protein